MGGDIERNMIEPNLNNLSIDSQCELLGKSRSWYYYSSTMNPEKLNIENSDKQKILKIWKDIPQYGYRKIYHEAKERGFSISLKRIYRLMHDMELQAVYPKPRLSIPTKEHKKYPYLLRGLAINRPNQVWVSDITYIKLPCGTLYLVAILDLYSRKVLSWRISNTMTVDFCLDALEDALTKYGCPEIFNSDQGSQYTSDAFIEALEDKSIRISMDGKGRVFDNIFIERLWRTVKYENIFLWNYETFKELKQGLKMYFKFYNSRRFHQSLEYKRPDEIYFNQIDERKAAC